MQRGKTSLSGDVSRMLATPPAIPIKMPKRFLLSKKEPPIVYYPKPIPPPDVLPLTRTVSIIFIQYYPTNNNLKFCLNQTLLKSLSNHFNVF